MSSDQWRSELPHYRQSNGYHCCIMLSTWLCCGFLIFFLYSLCIDNLSFICISFVGFIHTLLILSFAIYQFRKASIMEMIEEDQDNAFDLNVITKDDAFDSSNLIFTRYKLCSCVLHIADYLDKHALQSIRKQERHERIQMLKHQTVSKYNPV
eukprot:55510_1